MQMQKMLKFVGAVTILLGGFGLGWFFSATGTGQAVPVASLTELEREFTEQMRNVVLVGHFTIEGRERRWHKRDSNRFQRPFEWGIEHLNLGNGSSTDVST